MHHHLGPDAGSFDSGRQVVYGILIQECPGSKGKNGVRGRT